MSIAFKLAGAIFAALCAALLVNVYAGILIHSASADDDAARDQKVMAAAIASAVESVWSLHGREPALKVIDAANSRDDRLVIRWVDLPIHATDTGLLMEISPEMLSRDRHVVNIVTEPDGVRTMYSHGAVSTGQGALGAVQIKEQLLDQGRFVSTLSVVAAITGGSMALLAALLALTLGKRWISVPVGHLIEATKRVAGGAFDARVEAHGSSELSDLSRAINEMSGNLERAMEQLRHADRLHTVGELSAGVAHELGTPLHVIIGRSKAIIADETCPEHLRDNADRVVKQAGRMSDIIRQLLTFAHSKNLHKRTSNMRGILADALAMVTSMALEKRVTLHVVDSRDIPIVDVDPNQMQQVLTNLLINAIHASEANGEVTMEFSRTTTPPDVLGLAGLASCVVCSITDAGAGIPEATLARIFEPFFTTKEVGAGTGLGLSVAQGIVSEHGGHIGVETTHGAGSCFSIYLPEP